MLGARFVNLIAEVFFVPDAVTTSVALYGKPTAFVLHNHLQSLLSVALFEDPMKVWRSRKAFSICSRGRRKVEARHLSPPSDSLRSRSRFRRRLRRRQPPRPSALQSLSIKPTMPSRDDPDESTDLALQVATTVLAILLSSVLMAEVIFLPFGVLVVPGVPMFLALCLASSLWLRCFEPF